MTVNRGGVGNATPQVTYKTNILVVIANLIGKKRLMKKGAKTCPRALTPR